MKHIYGQPIGSFTSVNHMIDLGEIHVLGQAHYQGEMAQRIELSPDGKKWLPSACLSATSFDFKGETARFIKIMGTSEFRLDCVEGDGLIGQADAAWTAMFQRTEGWGGGDGFFTFNLKGGNERPDLADDAVRTLCVFGDTLVSTMDPTTKERVGPIVMPNSSIAIIEGKQPRLDRITFTLNKDAKGRLISFMEPSVDLGFTGTLASHLTRIGYDSNQSTPWTTTDHPTSIQLDFDLQAVYPLDHLDVFNYFCPPLVKNHAEARGLKNIQISYSTNGVDYTVWGEAALAMADVSQQGTNATTIALNGVSARYVRFSASPIPGVGNFGGVNGKEALFGLSKVNFYAHHHGLLYDVLATANTELYKTSKNSWYWLQDGVLVNQHLYFFPLLVIQDLKAPEGFQFAIEGISMLKVPVENDTPRFDLLTQKDVNLYHKVDGREWYWGAAFYANTTSAGAPNPDGYIYIYGYTSKLDELANGRRLRVARVLPEHFENINEWHYFDGRTWTTDPFSAVPLLDHVSCELSVSYHRGQYVCVFTYDVQSTYLTYATAPTPFGPFSSPKIAYVAPEKGVKLYQYNGKAHPHLSTPEYLLASYNVNTASWDENMEDQSLYAPRMVRLISTK
jgi:hypothetical protein